MKLFHVFGSICFMYNSKEHHNKFDVRADEAMVLGYSLMSKEYRVLNKKSKKIEESYYVKFYDKYIKSFQKNDVQHAKIFPSSCSKTIPLMPLYDAFVNLFDEPAKQYLHNPKVLTIKRTRY